MEVELGPSTINLLESIHSDGTIIQPVTFVGDHADVKKKQVR